MSRLLTTLRSRAAGGGGGGGSWTAYRYHRINISAANSSFDGRVSIAELELRTSAGGAQAASGGTATAKSTNTTNAAGNAFDANASTYWRSAGDSSAGGSLPQWLQYDMGVGVDLAVAEYAIQARSDGLSPPTAWTFEGSDDGSTWTTLDTQTGITPWTGGETKVFSVPEP